MKKPLDITGQRFGRLVAIELAFIKKHAYWLCRCDCGKATTVSIGKLRSGSTRSCFCLHRDTARALMFRHGQTGSREWRSWIHARERCFNQNTRNYSDYGGRGITVCDRWNNSFSEFFSDVGKCPPKMQLDRINNNGHYSCGKCPQCITNQWPMNCRWATRRIQNNNQRTTILLTINKTTLPLREWARKTGLTPICLWARVRVLKWPPDKWLIPSKPPQRKRRPVPPSMPEQNLE